MSDICTNSELTGFTGVTGVQGLVRNKSEMVVRIKGSMNSGINSENLAKLP